jgi:hypothetical protein
MAAYTLRLFEDKLPALPPGVVPANATPVPLPRERRIVYVAEGGLILSHPTGGRSVLADDAWIGSAAVNLVGGPAGARVYRWELTSTSAPAGILPKASTGAESRLLLASAVDLDPKTGWLLRCDRVDFPKGGIAYTHVHQGPGIRCCVKGDIRVDSEGKSHTFRVGEPWFERGPEPVLAFASETAETAFVRGFVLPRAIKGRSSIRYVLPEDQDKPKPQKYRVYGEEFVDL